MGLKAENQRWFSSPNAVNLKQVSPVVKTRSNTRNTRNIYIYIYIAKILKKNTSQFYINASLCIF